MSEEEEVKPAPPPPPEERVSHKSVGRGSPVTNSQSCRQHSREGDGGIPV